MPLSETFWIAFVSSVSASCLITMRWCYRSKCSRIQFCGVDIQRDVRGEEKLDMVIPESSNKIERTISL